MGKDYVEAKQSKSGPQGLARLWILVRYPRSTAYGLLLLLLVL